MPRPRYISNVTLFFRNYYTSVMSLWAVVLVTLSSLCSTRSQYSAPNHLLRTYELPHFHYAPDYGRYVPGVDDTPAYSYAVVNNPYYFYSVFQAPELLAPSIIGGPGLSAEDHAAYAPSHKTSLVPQNPFYVPEGSFVTPDAVFENDSANDAVSETGPDTFGNHHLTADPSAEIPETNFGDNSVPFYGNDSDSPSSGTPTFPPTFIPASSAPPSPNIVRGQGGPVAPLFNPENPSSQSHPAPSSEDTLRTRYIPTPFFPGSPNIVRGEEVPVSVHRTPLYPITHPDLSPTLTPRVYDSPELFPNPTSPPPTEFTKPIFTPIATAHEGRVAPVFGPYSPPSHDHHSKVSPQHIPTQPRVVYEAPGHSHPQRR